MIPFHRFLIGTAILFCLGFAAWAGESYRVSGGSGELALAVIFAVLGLGLTYYLMNLNRFLHR